MAAVHPCAQCTTHLPLGWGLTSGSTSLRGFALGLVLSGTALALRGFRARGLLFALAAFFIIAIGRFFRVVAGGDFSLPGRGCPAAGGQ